jgi:hypothetical protein
MLFMEINMLLVAYCSLTTLVYHVLIMLNIFIMLDIGLLIVSRNTVLIMHLHLLLPLVITLNGVDSIKQWDRNNKKFMNMEKLLLKAFKVNQEI